MTLLAQPQGMRGIAFIVYNVCAFPQGTIPDIVSVEIPSNCMSCLAALIVLIIYRKMIIFVKRPIIGQ